MAITTLCKTLGVSTSAYFRWIDNPIGKREANNYDLDQAIIQIFNDHKSRYGSVRVYRELKDKGWKVTQPRVSKRMRLLGLQAKASKKYKVTTNSDHDKKVADNLLDQDFDAQDINQKWVTDITYIPTQEGWIYLCVVIDLFSRAVIGWSMDKRMKAELVCNALNMALFRRDFPTGVIIHSDRGTQYCSEKFQNLIGDNLLLSSMSSKGCCYDNAACESFFGTLKVELVHDEKYKTRDEAKSSIFEYIEAYYNTKRKHSTINYMTPSHFEYIMKNEVNNCPKLAG
ncbi:integrase core domain protein [Francisella sp. TX07-6608]|nr:integrase core domain protein [Francisella sp. TX07-6608]OIN84331.1 integrase core domain protein [Francisella sp. TX07-6608]OIN84597.1 integrase core domain protein [Francisella sp. TX07-6608]OIN84714.1 integrase core domain protein [Francisella sp. TX07-6608]OIN84767.1 integrase core domain protein [Francisella sp. TX07-6608]